MTEPALNLTIAPAMLGKYSNNLVKDADEDGEEASRWTFPVTCLLSAEQLNTILGAPYFDRGLFNTDGKQVRPADGWAHCEAVKVSLDWEEAHVTLTPNAGAPMSFENCKISGLTFKPIHGGIDCEFKLQLCPGHGKENGRLQDLQKAEVRQLEILEAKVAVKKNTAQQEMAFETVIDDNAGKSLREQAEAVFQ